MMWPVKINIGILFYPTEWAGNLRKAHDKKLFKKIEKNA